MLHRRPLPSASLARVEEEHRLLDRWLCSNRAPSSRDGASWKDTLSRFAEAARRHREVEEELLRLHGHEALTEHREAHAEVEAEIVRAASAEETSAGPLRACELVASWLELHREAWLKASRG